MANQIRAFGLRQINPTGKSLLIFRNRVKPRNQKYFASHSTQISSLIPAVLPTEGRAHVTNAVRDAMDAAASGERMRAGRMMLMRTAKSCRSGAPGLASSLREDAQATVTTKPGHRGEHEVSRKTIAQGRPGLFRCTCGDYARVLYLFRTRGRGCIGHPAFPAPSILREAKRFLEKLARNARRDREAVFDVIARSDLSAVVQRAKSEATKQSSF